MLRQIVTVGILFLVGGLLIGALAYTAAHKMTSHNPDREIGTSGTAPP